MTNTEQRLKEAEHILALILVAMGKLDMFAARKLAEDYFEKWEHDQ